MLHLILVVKKQNRVLEGHCCHPIFNSPLCVKITISLKWTITALLSMVAQVFPLNQFIILLFVFRKECSPRCRLGSWWWLSHIPFLFPICCGGRGWMNEGVISPSFLISLHVQQATWKYQLFGSAKTLHSALCLLASSQGWHEVVIRECYYKEVCSHHPCFPAQAKQGNDTHPLFV